MSCACACEVMFTQPPATISLLILLDSCKLHHKYPFRSHLTLYWPCVIIMHLVCVYICLACTVVVQLKDVLVSFSRHQRGFPVFVSLV